MYGIPITKSITWDASKIINALITGSRGMGKSWFAMYLTLKLAVLEPPSQIFAIDFKQSDISRWSQILPDQRVAATKQEIFSLLEHYVNLMKERGQFIKNNAKYGSTANSLGMPLYYLIYDEMGAFASTLDSKEKKLHDTFLSQIVLLGRQYNFGLLAIMQQASVGNSGLNSSIKEQFGLIVHMGDSNQMAYRQTFGENMTFPNEKLDRGEGLLYLQGLTTNGHVKPFKAKDLSSLDLWQALQTAFQNQNDKKYLQLMTKNHISRRA
ncbi:MAG: FtsK/SpoIIIE domain-containing protein [Oenococcus sp.]|uniref:FtsK/SpoIIIE domain-containing protein n=1 Tax=Oenococcus sp. TaxID=1979414 RepID=UPI0039EA1A35